MTCGTVGLTNLSRGTDASVFDQQVTLVALVGRQQPELELVFVCFFKKKKQKTFGIKKKSGLVFTSLGSRPRSS